MDLDQQALLESVSDGIPVLAGQRASASMNGSCWTGARNRSLRRAGVRAKNDIYVHANDTIFTYREPQTFLAFGATGYEKENKEAVPP